uniref:Uncharacterized protein n=1 Tax=Brassica campestris TaxID=3711 RepID=A0A3P6BPA0_BRACM|nr:unnamed protein product [Brassica rapa]
MNTIENVKMMTLESLSKLRTQSSSGPLVSQQKVKLYLKRRLPSAPTPAEERETEDQQVSLKTPIPFRYPAGTKTLPFEHMSKSLQRRYVKVKEPLFDPVTSKRIYWREEPFDVNGKDDDHGHDHGCLFFLKVSIRGMVDKWFGPLLGLPKTEDFNY